MLTGLWSPLSKPAVMIGSIGGTALAIMTWLITCRFVYGSINTTNLASNFSSPLLYQPFPLPFFMRPNIPSQILPIVYASPC